MGKIRRKQSSTQKEWLEAILGLNINEERVKRLTDNAVEKLIRSPYKKSGYGWSGGKDGLVLQKICELAGIKRAVLFITSLEFKDYLDFVEEYKPPYVEVGNIKREREIFYRGSEEWTKKVFQRQQIRPSCYRTQKS